MKQGLSFLQYTSLFLLLSILHTTTAFSQTKAVWDRTLGGTGDDIVTTSLATADGGYLVGGYSNSNAGADKTENSRGGNDYWVVKVDASGNKVWDKTYGGSDDDWLYTMVITADGGYLLAGTSASGKGADKSEDSKGGNDYWIIKIDANGNNVWDRTFGGTNNDTLSALISTKDGGFLLGGSSNSQKGGDKSEYSRGGMDYWIIKINSQGNELWDKTIGAANYDALSALLPTPDGGYLLGGSSNSKKGFDKTQNSKGSNGSLDFWIVKIDGNGNELWDKDFGTASGYSDSNSDFLSALLATADGGYLVGGSSAFQFPTIVELDFWVVKVDANGNMQWTRTYVGGRQAEILSALATTSDGGYLMGGTNNSDGYLSGRGSEYWIVKTDSNGAKQWDKSLNGSETENLSAITPTADGYYLLAGTSNSSKGIDKSENGKGGNDYWIVKIGFPLYSLTTTALSSSSYKAGDTVHVSYTATGTYPVGNNFTVQLSDAFGSFVFYRNIGTNQR